MAEEITSTKTTEEKKPRKKKRRKKHYLLRFLIFLLIIGGIIYGMNTAFFDIAYIDVDGNSYYTDEQIKEMSGLTKGMNIFFDVKLDSAYDMLTSDPYIREAELSRVMPDTIRISVDERYDAAAVKYGNAYIVIDDEGIVLRMGETEPKVTLITGLTLTTVEVGRPLIAEENYELSDTLEIINRMSSGDVYFKKIDCSGVMFRAYIYDTLCVCGMPDVIMCNIENGGLSKMLYSLYEDGVQRGTVTLSTDGTYAFSGEVVN